MHGVVYQPAGVFPVMCDAGGVAFESRRLPWVLAGQLIMEFQEFTIVDLAAEHAAYLKRA
ncbi:hypothetical protein [Streptomyces odonnellii]|uniref:hypothetical protein n=1 Tax=Streptomyces odonnellii TaxID=1417980 RepID=UPI001E41460A|nr:hypothetical protein [Streptomyces odonnellii]